MTLQFPGGAPSDDQEWSDRWRRWLGDIGEWVKEKIAAHDTALDDIAQFFGFTDLAGMQGGSEILYNDYLVAGTAVATSGSAVPDFDELRNGLYLYAFAGTGPTVEQAFFTIHILHNISDGSSPTFHVHWTHNNATPSGDVKWQIDYSIARGYGVDAFPAPTTVTSTQTAGAQYIHHITSDDDMTMTFANIEPDCVLIGRIYRDPADGSDTFADDAFLIQVDMHFEMGQVSTIDRNRPFTGF